MAPPRRRQIHLDFHTSEHVTHVGRDFDADRFGDAVAATGADCIVLFAKCHHGWSYYDTEVGARHPHLGFDLLGAQVAACRARGIATKIYLSVGWDERAAREQPGWRRVAPDGSFAMMMGRNLEASWAYLCLNTGYLDLVAAQAAELARRFADADGLWLDIVRQAECCCARCRADMDTSGLDWTQAAHRAEHARVVFDRYRARLAGSVGQAAPGLTLFHNSSMAPPGARDFYAALDQVEVEALPTGGWGYDHFPLAARHLDGLGHPIMGVTARFHVIWGELGSTKLPDALHAECAVMQAHGAAVCVGDHLDPRGRPDAIAWDTIGRVFAAARAVEPVLDGTRPVADMAVLSSIGVRAPGSFRREDRHVPEDEGALRILSEGQAQFDIVDGAADFSRYGLLILPDRVRLSQALAERLAAYVAAGGKLLLSAESGLAADGGHYALETGAAFCGPSPWDPTYALPEPAMRPAAIGLPFVMFGPSVQLRPTLGQSLGEVFAPLFNRTPRQFNGHLFAPPQDAPTGYALGVRHGGIVTLAHPVFSLYRKLGHPALRGFVLAVIRALREVPPRIATALPAGATVTLRAGAGRLLLQAVYAPRFLRGETVLGPLETIEEGPLLAPASCTVRVAGRVTRVRDALGSADLAFTQDAGVVRFQLPAFRLRSVIEILLAEQAA